MMTSVLTGTGIVCGGLAIWTGIEQNLLLVRRKTIFLKRLPPEFDGFTILQLSDLHKRELGDCNSRIIQQVRLLQPRLVALTGDLISRDCRDFSRTGIFLRELSAACPHVYACLGNLSWICRLRYGKRCGIRCPVPVSACWTTKRWNSSGKALRSFWLAPV